MQLAGLYLFGVVNPRAISWIFNMQIQVREQETFEKLYERFKLLNHTYSSTPPSTHYLLLSKDYAATCTGERRRQHRYTIKTSNKLH